MESANACIRVIAWELLIPSAQIFRSTGSSVGKAWARRMEEKGEVAGMASQKSRKNRRMECSLVRVVPRSPLRQVHQRRGRSESRSVLGREGFERIHDLGRTEGIEIAQGTSPEGGKADTKDRAQIPVTGRSHHAFGDGQRGFVQHEVYQPVLHQGRVDLSQGGHAE